MKPEEVSKLALGLPVQARAKLALDLLASLENVSGFDIGRGWLGQLTRLTAINPRLSDSSVVRNE